MTIHEASERYNIPLEILREYESWGLCGTVKEVMGAWQYDDTDLERLSMIMTLHDVGFENAEIETYMKLLLEQEELRYSACGCWIRSGGVRWTRSISGSGSWSGWTISVTTSASSRKQNKVNHCLNASR